MSLDVERERRLALWQLPSLETIARMALVSKRTVLNAVAWLALYVFLEKLRRVVRQQGMLGPRTVQTSNAYVLTFPKCLGALATNVFRLVADGNNCTPSDSKGSDVSRLLGSETLRYKRFFKRTCGTLGLWQRLRCECRGAC